MSTTSAMIGYDPILVALSITIATFAAYTALELGDRASLGSGRTRSVWMAAAAIAMGGGIWSMHFIGMLAFRLQVPVAYDLGRTILSLLVAVVSTAAAFFWVNKDRQARTGRAGQLIAASRIGIAGLFMGGAIAGMHYIGMAAMQMPMELSFAGGRVILSVLIAIIASIAGLSIAFRHQTLAMRIAAAVVMGLAVSGMHYTGMWAAHFTPDAAMLTAHAAMVGTAHAVTATAPDGNLGPTGLALSVVLATFLILFLALLASNVTQQRSQRMLRQSDLRFRVVAEAVGDIIWTNSPDGRMVGEQLDWSRFTGQSRAEHDGFGWSDAIHPDDLAPTLEAWTEAVENRRQFVFEHRVRRFDGAWRVCAVRALPVLGEAGAIVEWVGVHEDITERRDAEFELRAARDRAEAASEVKSNFIANMSHELRTPLSAIIGYTEMIMEECEEAGDGAAILSDLGKIESNARHLLGLINDILDLTKIEAGRMDVLVEGIDLVPLLHRIEADIRPLVERRANRLRLVPPPVPVEMQTDMTKLRQMLLNLLGNAAKFTEGGTITLAVHRAADDAAMVVFDVTDTGIGMTEEQTNRLFERFTQADKSTTRRFGGTGLGLALTKAYASMLGGSISVRSTAGAGSTFTLRLPAVFRPEVGGRPADGDAEPGDPARSLEGSPAETEARSHVRAT